MSDAQVRIKISGDASDAKRATQEVETALKGVSTSAKAADDSSKALATSIGSLKTAMAGFVGITAFAGLSKSILDVNMSVEMLRAQLKSLEGSDAGARSTFEFIKQFATETPFEIEGLTKAFIGLRNYGITPTSEVMGAITNQASKLGASQETLEGITRALGQAYAKGKLQAEEMMQLAERGVPIYDLLAQVTGKNTAELFEMSQQGALTRDVIDQLIKKMGEMAQGGNANAMNTLKGSISNLSDAWHSFEDALLNDKSEGIIKGIVGSITRSLNILSRNMSDGLQSQVDRAKARIATFDSMGSVGKAIADYTGYDIGVEKNKLASLEAQQKKEQAAKQAAEQQQASAKAIAQTDEWLTAIEEQDAERSKKAKEKKSKASDSAAQAEAARAQSIRAIIEQLQFEISTEGLSNEQKQIATALRSATKNATQQEAAAIKDLITQKYADIEASKRQQAAWDESIKNANAFVDIKKEIEAFNRADSVSVSSMSGLMGKIQDQAKANDFNPEQMQALYDQLGRAWNDGFIEPAKNGTKELSEFAKQAARNMQSTFADFLFDPFKEGLDGMASGFLDAIRRMLANALSANLMEGLFGSNFMAGGGKGGGLGGLLGEGASFISSFFHTGGVIGNGNSGGTRAVNPAIFFNAPRYHSGGIASDEVPAVLQKGEEVLTANDPRHRNNLGSAATGGGSASNITSIVVMDPNFVPDAMAGAAGSQIVINHIKDNASSIKRVLETA